MSKTVSRYILICQDCSSYKTTLRISCLGPMKRILTAIVLILVVFALIFFGNIWLMTLFSVIVAELAAYEYLKLAAVGAEAHGLKLRIPIWWMALGTALAFVVTLPNFPVEAQLPVLSALTINRKSTRLNSSHAN